MERINDILKAVLSSNLLGASIGDIAEKLGYKGRSTLYRVINGTASERAVARVCQKLKEILFIDEDSLKCMMATITNTDKLSRILKPFMNLKKISSVQTVVDAFLSKDFTIFPEDFQHRYLNILLALEQDDPDAFYSMIAYFYYKYSAVEYYVKGDSHRQRCSRVVETLGKRLIEKYPENDLAVAQVYNYSKSEIFNGEAPILWSLIGSLSTLLQTFGRPIDLVNELHFLSLPHNRDYWETGKKNEIVLTNAAPTLIANNYTYDVFRIDLETNRIEYTGSMCFLSEEILSFYSASQKTSKLGVYEFDEQVLGIGWENPNDDPTTVGNRWILLEMRLSQRLNMLDKSIDDEYLYSTKLQREGYRKNQGYEVNDVIISRETLSIKLAQGRVLTIPISEAPFLKKIKPQFMVVVYERESDNRNFVWWPQIMHCLPLEMFTEIES